MDFLPHIAARVIGTPLLIDHAKLEVILSVIGNRIGLQTPELIGNDFPAVDPASYAITSDGIGIIPIRGTLVKRASGVDAQSGLMSYDTIETMFLDAITDPAVRAIMLDIDSPGGEVGGVFDLGQTMMDMRGTKPVWAFADNAFSGAYLLASAADKIFLTQTSGVGSVGVMSVHRDESAKDQQQGISYTTITAGANKADFSPHSPLTDGAKARLQAEVNRVYDMFTSFVAVGRSIPIEAVKATEAGIFYGAEALNVRFADQVSTLREAVANLTETIKPKIITTINRKDLTMEAPSQAVEAAAKAAAPVADEGAVRSKIEAEMQAKMLADAKAVSEMCLLAGAPELAGDFIASGKTQEQIRGELLARRVSSQEIHSQVMPSDSTRIETVNLENNPLVKACQKLAGKS
ncbi:MAG: S49 family peptidase [Magnetococcales bacterium]|nr:S49 family peptidase [Magnetococcales bacterium]